MRTFIPVFAVAAVVAVAALGCKRSGVPAYEGEALSVPVPTSTEVELQPASPAEQVSTTEVTSGTIEVGPIEVVPPPKTDEPEAPPR